MSTLTRTSKPVSEGQVKLITRIIGGVADSDTVQESIKSLSTKAAERLEGNARFAEALRQSAAEKIVEFGVNDEYANEEVESKYGYFSGYRKPTRLHNQINLLRMLFPWLGIANPSLLEEIDRGVVRLPQYAEGWFAVPNLAKPEVLAQFGGSYCAAVEMMFSKMKETRMDRFTNYWEGKIDETHLRQSALSIEFWKQISEAQGNQDIVVIAAQFGLRHRGRSVRRARVVMEDTPGEFGLGAFHVGVMLLTHPNRLQHYDDLWIDCAGDELSPNDAGVFSCAPCFRFGGGKIEFDSSDVGCVFEFCGAGSASAPQLKLVA